MKPIVKWAGGKSQLLDVIAPLLPQSFGRYYEPFLGGGALLLERQPSIAIVSDVNTELITTFKVVKDNYQDLIDLLKEHVQKHNASDASEYYKSVRSLKVDNLTDLETAARFIYLNKVGFNGLYRVNSKGEFNVPFGKKENITMSTLCNQANLKRVSQYLTSNDINIHNSDFEEIIDQAKAGDFIFVDSPYDNAFSSYSAEGFGEHEHIRLAQALERATNRGVKWMVTNHNTPLIRRLYASNHFFEVPVNRFINSDAKNRAGATSEVIIVNYFDEIKKASLDIYEEAKFFKQLKPTSFILKDYVRWQGIQERIRSNRLFLNDLNLLHASDEKSFRVKFDELYSERPESFALLPLLIASRKDKYEYWLSSGEPEAFDSNDKDITYRFLRDSGLMDNLFLNVSYGNVFDYLLDVEVGLTSNDKKNSSGAWMTKQVEMMLRDHGIRFEKEVLYSRIAPTSRVEDERFDFVFSANGQKYCMEVNFFNTKGSKINSEAARFIEIDGEFRKYDKLNFVWVTDGVGLRHSKPDITLALRNIKHMFNLTTFETFIKELV